MEKGFVELPVAVGEEDAKEGVVRRGTAAGHEHVHIVTVQEEVKGEVVTPADIVTRIDAAMRMSSCSSVDLKAAAAAPGLTEQRCDTV